MLFATTWIGLESLMLCEKSQPEKGTNYFNLMAYADLDARLSKEFKTTIINLFQELKETTFMNR